ncbi:MAG: FMN-binding negative transcriptional regulator [Elainellaceae cyanobacterium]
MYVPSAFREENTETLVAFMQAHSFATLVSIRDGMPVASHIPLVATRQDDAIVLSGHLAKQNPQWQAFADHESLAIFTGPHAYVSPDAYEKRENVPTWNYIAVHAYGHPRPITLDSSREQMDQMIEDMVNTYGPSYSAQWHSLSEGYRKGMMEGIVGFEMVVTRLDGKYKLSQNRTPADQASVAHALLGSDRPEERATGEAMQQALNAEAQQ